METLCLVINEEMVIRAGTICGTEVAASEWCVVDTGRYGTCCYDAQEIRSVIVQTRLSCNHGVIEGSPCGSPFPCRWRPGWSAAILIFGIVLADTWLLYINVHYVTNYVTDSSYYLVHAQHYCISKVRKTSINFWWNISRFWIQ